MQVENLTKLSFGTKPTSRGVCASELVVIVRGRYRLEHGQPLTLLEPKFEGDLLTQGSLTAEVFADDDPERAGACRYPGDFADFKANAEVIVQGACCYAPRGAAVLECSVAVEVGAWQKLLRVVGLRAWSDRQFGAQLSEPLPFRSMPLDWGHAFGGPEWLLNPVGKGLGDELPNVEYPLLRITSRSDRPIPAGFGPINPGWAQRARKRGTGYGDDWKATRSPWYSADFDWSYFQAAPFDQQLPGYLKGDEVLRFTNLHPQQPVLESRLPGTRVRAFIRCRGEQIREVAMKLDTLYADLEAGTVALTWRGLARVAEDDLVDVATLLLASEPLGESLRAQHYEELLTDFEADPLGLKAFQPLVDERDAGLARLAAATGAMAKIGSGGEAALAGELGEVMRVAGGKDDPTAAERVRQIASALAERRKQEPAASDLSAPLREAFSAPARAPSPPALKFPTPGKPPQSPAIAGAMQDWLERVRAAELQLGEARAKAELPPSPLLPTLEVVVAELGPRERPPMEPGPGLDLSEQDYSYRDLRGRDLSGSNLSCALLTGADLRGASLARANLSHAVLHQADLTGADLSGATLMLTTLSEVKARGAILKGAMAERAFVTDTDLADADLTDFSGNYLVMTRVDLSGCKLVGARLTDSLIDASKLDRVDASGIALTAMLLLGCELSESNFEGALLVRTSFNKSSARKASFRRARGRGAIFFEADLERADFTLAVLPEALFFQASAPSASFYGANLKEARFYRAVLDRADFFGANLHGADLRKASLDRTRFVNASLFAAIFVGASGRDTDFTGANLRRCITDNT